MPPRGNIPVQIVVKCPPPPPPVRMDWASREVFQNPSKPKLHLQLSMSISLCIYPTCRWYLPLINASIFNTAVWRLMLRCGLLPLVLSLHYDKILVADRRQYWCLNAIPCKQNSQILGTIQKTLLGAWGFSTFAGKIWAPHPSKNWQKTTWALP